MLSKVTLSRWLAHAKRHSITTTKCSAGHLLSSAALMHLAAQPCCHHLRCSASTYCLPLLTCCANGVRPFHRPQPPLTQSLPSAGKYCIEVSRLNLCLLHPCSCNIFLFCSIEIGTSILSHISSAAPGCATFGAAQVQAKFGGRPWPRQIWHGTDPSQFWRPGTGNAADGVRV